MSASVPLCGSLPVDASVTCDSHVHCCVSVRAPRESPQFNGGTAEPRDFDAETQRAAEAQRTAEHHFLEDFFKSVSGVLWVSALPLESLRKNSVVPWFP
jgi:hypothetical protein